MTTDSLLSELQRQKKYLDKLPDGFTFPLFNARQALESQRSSGYRNTAAASREIVDNAIEAGARRVDVVFDAEREGNRRMINAIAFIDDGAGMLPMMARYALSWGGGTHFDDPSFIGRFGFGLPNASINQTRCVEIYTRTTSAQMFTKVRLDINDFPDYGIQSIPEPTEAELPAFVQRYLDKNKIAFANGTVVIWLKPDRLTYKTAAYLKEHLLDDFGVIYRYLLENQEEPPLIKDRPALKLIVEGVAVEPVDPLFLLPGARYYPKHHKSEKDAAHLVSERFLPVEYSNDTVTGERHLKVVADLSGLDLTDRSLIAMGTIHIRIVRFPVGFAEAKKRKRAETTDANHRFDIRKTRRGMSFVRAGREIQTIDAFPRSGRDEASGLGNWPLLQSYAYHWGVETRFSPELDEVFGITNDKQSVRPSEDFWRILHEENIDAALLQENQWQASQRDRVLPPPMSKEGPSQAELSVQDVDAARGERPRVPTHRLEEAKEQLESEVQHRADIMQRSLEEVRQAFEKETKTRRYHIDYFEREDGPFYEPKWVGSQVVVLINRRHQFYEVLYKNLLQLPGGHFAKEAVDVLLLTLGKAELTAEDEEMTTWYQEQRKHNWSRFLEIAMKSLGQRFPTSEEATSEAGDEKAQGTVEVA